MVKHVIIKFYLTPGPSAQDVPMPAYRKDVENPAWLSRRRGEIAAEKSLMEKSGKLLMGCDLFFACVLREYGKYKGVPAGSGVNGPCPRLNACDSVCFFKLIVCISSLLYINMLIQSGSSYFVIRHSILN